MSPDVWPFARQNMTPDERAEVSAWGRAHPGVPVVVGYNRRHGYFARVGGGYAPGGTRAIDAFRKAAAEWSAARAVVIDSLLGGAA